MSDYQQSADIDATADEVFGYLADLANLPDYFPGMVSAEPAGGDAVRTVAVIGGEREEGEAWVRRDHDAKHLAWGAEGSNDYHGELDVEPNDDTGARVTVFLHTNRGESDRIRGGLEETLANLKRRVEHRVTVGR